MQDPALLSAPDALSEPARVIDVFFAPTKTFTDIRRRATWWLPFLIVCAFSFFFAHTVLTRVGMPTLVDGTIRNSSVLESQMNNATPEVAARLRSRMETQFRLMYISPAFLLLFGAISSAVLMATANFGFAGRARYAQMLAVWFYATLPLLFISLITVVLIYAGVGTETFNIRNSAGTNVGYYLQDGSSPRWLVTMLSSLDLFALWTAVLLSLGVSIVAGSSAGPPRPWCSAGGFYMCSARPC